MSKEPPKSTEGSELQIRREAGLAKLPNGNSSALSEIVRRSLIHIQTSKALGARHRIGEYEILGPDYRLVCAWAEQLQLTREEVLTSLLTPGAESWRNWDTCLLNGRFKSLRVPEKILPIYSIPNIAGLVVETLSLELENDFSNLSLSSFPNLKKLCCRVTELRNLDLSGAPLLTELLCDCNRLKGLDLSTVPFLSVLWCDSNGLSNLDLSGVPLLTELRCGSNRLESLDLSAVPRLTTLSCGCHQLAELDLTSVPHLTKLSIAHRNAFFGHGNRAKPLKLDLSPVPLLNELCCTDAELTELDLSAVPLLLELKCASNHLLTKLDISPLKYLSRLEYDQDKVVLIQRPDQNFR